MALTIRFYNDGGEHLVNEVRFEDHEDAVLTVTRHEIPVVDVREIFDELHLNYRSRDCE